MSTIPKNRPTLDTGVALITIQSKLLTDVYLDPTAILRDCAVALLVIRMASPKVVYGKYDDLIVAVWLDGSRPVLVVNGNADPSRVGPSPLAHGKDEARLKPGVWAMIRGHHNDNPKCFRQANEEQAATLGFPKYFKDPVRAKGHFTVERMHTATESKDDSGLFHLNFHPGGAHGTSSAGCLTVPQPQYDEIRDAIYPVMEASKQPFLPIVLVLGPL